MNYSEKSKIIQNAIEYLRLCPNGKKTKRRSFLRMKHLDNAKVFFEIFIPKVLNGNKNDQFRRLQYIKTELEIVLQEIPEKDESYSNRYIFKNSRVKAVITGKNKIRKKKLCVDYFLLSFFPY